MACAFWWSRPRSGHSRQREAEIARQVYEDGLGNGASSRIAWCAEATREGFGDCTRPPDSGLLKGSSLIRCHHLLKTFYTGSGGWADKQLPDGTVVWTAPTGRTYTTKPGGSLFFPILATPTGEVAIL